jgi:hypothetical protein
MNRNVWVAGLIALGAVLAGGAVLKAKAESACTTIAGAPCICHTSGATSTYHGSATCFGGVASNGASNIGKVQAEFAQMPSGFRPTRRIKFGVQSGSSMQVLGAAICTQGDGRFEAGTFSEAGSGQWNSSTFGSAPFVQVCHTASKPFASLVQCRVRDIFVGNNNEC